MRKTVRLLAVAVGGLLGGMATSASAGSSADINVTVTVRMLSVSVDSNAWALGVVNAGEKKVATSAITITNDGNAAEDFTLKGANSANWTLDTAAGANKFALYARMQTAQPAEADFGAGDQLTTSSVAADGTKFGGGGYDVAASGTQKLWMRFDVPTSSTSAAQQTITVTVGCQAH